MIFRILIGLLLAAAGLFMVLRTPSIEDFFGPVDWAERHLGGTSMFYKLLGVLVCFIGFMVITNLWDAFLVVVLGPLFPSKI